MVSISENQKLLVKVNKTENYLYIRLNGFFNCEDAHIAIQNLNEGIEQLDPGFVLVNDISSFQPITQEVAQYIMKAQQQLMESGVSKVIRIVSDSKVSKMQFEHSQKKADAMYNVEYATSIEDAKRMLASHKEYYPEY